MSDVATLLSFGPDGWGDELASGLWLTARLALAALPFGLAIGLGVALMRDSRSRLARGGSAVYVSVFRGLPELLTLFMIYHGAPRLATQAVALIERLSGWPASGYVAEIDAFWAGLLALSLVFGAFASETLLGALRGVPRGQREAAEALGFAPGAAFRLVVLPQALRLALPGLGNGWMTLLKDTSLVSVIALPDLMRQTNVAALSSRQHLLFYAVACLLYLVLSALSGRAIAALETRAARGLPAAVR